MQMISSCEERAQSDRILDKELTEQQKERETEAEELEDKLRETVLESSLMNNEVCEFDETDPDYLRLKDLRQKYCDLLGMSMQFTGRQEIKFTFHQLNQDDPEQDCSIVVRVPEGDLAQQQFVCDRCEPPIPGVQYQLVVSALNTTEKLPIFLYRMRANWKLMFKNRGMASTI